MANPADRTPNGSTGNRVDPAARGPGKSIIQMRHPEWIEHELGWRWLLDSLEAGDRYRQAIYGTDTRGLPIRNLIRHKREYPDPRDQPGNQAIYLGGNAQGLAGAVGPWGMGTPGSSGSGFPGSTGADYSGRATDDDYELRRARTPVPTFVQEVVGIHLGKVYAREVDRDPADLDDLEEWWKDVDGIGTSIDQWMSETIAPMLLVLGQLDVAFTHPDPPEGVDVLTRADEARLGLDRVVASYILPHNVLWWRLDARRRYTEILIREFSDPDAPNPDVHYRHWTPENIVMYDGNGDVVWSRGNPYRFVPVRRLFDRRKPRCRNVGKARYMGIAERQREYYNRDSELILSDTTQAHPLLQGPEDFVNADGTIPVGPAWLLPKKKNMQGGSASYEGFDVVDFPKGGAESLRQNKADIRDDVDRDAALTKPAGSRGSSGQTVAQSGVSKELDNISGNAILSDIAKVLGRAEKELAAMAIGVSRHDPEAFDLIEGVRIAYPMVFQLAGAQELVDIWTGWQALLGATNGAVETQLVALMEIVRKALPGRADQWYQEAEDEIRAEIEANRDARETGLEMMRGAALAVSDDSEPDASDDEQPAGESDPSLALSDPGTGNPPPLGGTLIH